MGIDPLWESFASLAEAEHGWLAGRQAAACTLGGSVSASARAAAQVP